MYQLLRRKLTLSQPKAGHCCSSMQVLAFSCSGLRSSLQREHNPFQLGLHSLNCFLKCKKYPQKHVQNYQRNLIICLCLIPYELARGLQTQVLQCKGLFMHPLLSAAVWLMQDTMQECVTGVAVTL